MTIQEFSESEFLAYLAALVDGEGSVDLPKGGGCGITIANTYYEVLDAINQRLGYGWITRREQRPGYWKPCYKFEIHDMATIERFLVPLQPYLQIKAEKAVRVLERISRTKGLRQAKNERNEAIRKAVKEGESRKSIARRLGLDPSTISYVLLRPISWGLTGHLKEKDTRRKVPRRKRGELLLPS